MPCAPTTARCAAHGWMQTAVSSTAAACAFGCMARKSTAIHWTSPAPPPPHNGRWPRRSKPLPPLPPQWSLAPPPEAMAPAPRGFGGYAAADYDELIDCPVELGIFWVGRFKACGIPHQMLVSGATPAFDGQRLLADTRKICETAIRFWHGPRGAAPHRRYLFMLHAVAEGYGGLEHRNCSALTCGRADLPRRQENRASEGYTTLLRLISHEYFHTWKRKSLRPAAFATYDHSRENYTELLWFFEGFTSYYDDLLLRRAGLIDDATYLRLLGKAINQLL